MSLFKKEKLLVEQYLGVGKLNLPLDQGRLHALLDDKIRQDIAGFVDLGGYGTLPNRQPTRQLAVDLITGKVAAEVAAKLVNISPVFMDLVNGVERGQWGTQESIRENKGTVLTGLIAERDADLRRVIEETAQKDTAMYVILARMMILEFAY